MKRLNKMKIEHYYQQVKVLEFGLRMLNGLKVVRIEFGKFFIENLLFFSFYKIIIKNYPNKARCLHITCVCYLIVSDGYHHIYRFLSLDL